LVPSLQGAKPIGSQFGETVKRIQHFVVAGVALVLAAAVVIGASQGLRWFMVETPSMGAVAPRGTLVITEPIAANKLHVGQIISFNPPTSVKQTYTHRIVAIGANGITTKGDINGAADGWDLQPRNIIGRVIVTLPGIGWLLKLLPIVAGGVFLVWALSLFINNRQARRTVRLFGTSMVVTFAVMLVRPFSNYEVVQAVPSEAGRNLVDYTVVNTGLMPMRFTSFNGQSFVIGDGELGVVHAQVNPVTNFVDLGAHLALNGWQLALLTALGAVPLLISIIHSQQSKREVAREAASATN
jgi:signal peptidase I